MHIPWIIVSATSPNHLTNPNPNPFCCTHRKRASGPIFQPSWWPFRWTAERDPPWMSWWMEVPEKLACLPQPWRHMSTVHHHSLDALQSWMQWEAAVDAHSAMPHDPPLQIPYPCRFVRCHRWRQPCCWTAVCGWCIGRIPRGWAGWQSRSSAWLRTARTRARSGSLLQAASREGDLLGASPLQRQRLFETFVESAAVTPTEVGATLPPPHNNLTADLVLCICGIRVSATICLIRWRIVTKSSKSKERSHERKCCTRSSDHSRIWEMWGTNKSLINSIHKNFCMMLTNLTWMLDPQNDNVSQQEQAAHGNAMRGTSRKWELQDSRG